MRVFYKEEEKKKVEKKESSGGAEREKKRRDFSYNHFYERLEDRLWSDLVKMQYGVPDDEAYILTSVDCWVSSPVAC